MMRPLTNLTQSAPFYVDKTRVSVDFGNSIAIDEYGAMDSLLKNDLLVAVHPGDSKVCSPDLLPLGFVNNKSPNWYRNTAGVQIFLFSKSPMEAAEWLSKYPLVVAEVRKNKKMTSVGHTLRYNRELKHATFLSHGRTPEVIILQARTLVSPRFSK